MASQSTRLAAVGQLLLEGGGGSGRRDKLHSKEFISANSSAFSASAASIGAPLDSNAKISNDGNGHDTQCNGVAHIQRHWLDKTRCKRWRRGWWHGHAALIQVLSIWGRSLAVEMTRQRLAPPSPWARCRRAGINRPYSKRRVILLQQRLGVSAVLLGGLLAPSPSPLANHSIGVQRFRKQTSPQRV